jgi:hypothetical protein
VSGELVEDAVEVSIGRRQKGVSGDAAVQLRCAFLSRLC